MRSDHRMLGAVSGAAFGLDVYDAVPTQLSRDNRLSLLALQYALRTRRGDYAYLEIGSHLGGSLQPFLHDDNCLEVYSIDPRPEAQADERGMRFPYPANSTQRMIDILRPAFNEKIGKLRTFDTDAADVRTDQLDRRPDLCFIDGENTDRAAQRDFESCRRLSRADAAIIFTNVHIVFRGFRLCVNSLREGGIRHRAYVLPRTIGIIELGEDEIWRDPLVLERLASATAPLYIAETLAHYRDGMLALKRLPGAELARRLMLRLGVGQGLEARRGDDDADA